MITLPWLTGPEFAKLSHEKPKWLIENWLPRGVLIDLVGEQKSAGKSVLCWILAKHIITGENFLEQKIFATGPVIYLTEQPGASFYEQSYKIGILNYEDFHIVIYTHVLGGSWKERAEAVVAYAKEIEAVLIIVDTFPHWADFVGNNENEAGPTIAATKPLQVACESGITVILSKHAARERVTLGAGKSTRGSTAGPATTDTIFDLANPDENGEGNVRKLTNIGRYDTIPRTSYIELDKDKWEYNLLKGPPKRDKQTSRDKIISALSLEEALSTMEVSQESGIPYTTTNKILPALAKQGQAIKVGSGVKGDEYRWLRAL